MTVCGAEIIDNKKIIDKKFDVWSVSCENDEMFYKVKCRMFVEITSGTTMFVNPNSVSNKLLFISSDVYFDTKAYVKIDDGKLYESDLIIQNKYNFIKFSAQSIRDLYDEIRVGEYFFIRYTVKDRISATGFKEITAKISLAEFQKAFVFFLNQRNKYDNFNNKK
jgi:hypothetical protein